MVLRVEALRTVFETEAGTVPAVDGVSFALARGSTLGIVGESGSGKSVTNLSILRLVPQPPGRIVSGRIEFDGQDLLTLSEGAMRAIRGKRISMIFQDPMTSLNPYLRVGRQLTEVVEEHESASPRSARARAIDMLARVGIPAPAQRFDSYPHELSGGMRQRVMIAMALLCRPEVLLADEPTTALDVTVQAQILDLVQGLRQEYGTAVVLVTHDLGVVAGVADEVAVMYAGRMIEQAPSAALFARPRHPYTRALLGTRPGLGGSRKRLAPIPGRPPEPATVRPGCAFAARCAHALDVCRHEFPPQRQVEPGHSLHCWVDLPLD